MFIIIILIIIIIIIIIGYKSLNCCQLWLTVKVLASWTLTGEFALQQKCVEFHKIEEFNEEWNNLRWKEQEKAKKSSEE